MTYLPIYAGGCESPFDDATRFPFVALPQNHQAMTKHGLRLLGLGLGLFSLGKAKKAVQMLDDLIRIVIQKFAKRVL